MYSLVEYSGNYSDTSASYARNKKKKHNKIVMLAKSKLKLNSIETLIPQALTDLEFNHEEVKTTVNENKV